MDECPVCGYGLDDCYDDDPGWMLCRDCEWCGYHDDSGSTRTPRYGIAPLTYSGCY